MDRILIVDDDSSIRALTVGILRRAGYETVEAEDGEAVLDLLDQDQRFSLIISDIYMPRMTGISLLKELQKCCPHIPVIISSVELNSRSDSHRYPGRRFVLLAATLHGKSAYECRAPGAKRPLINIG